MDRQPESEPEWQEPGYRPMQSENLHFTLLRKGNRSGRDVKISVGAIASDSVCESKWQLERSDTTV